MPKLRFSRDAGEDLKEIARHIARDKPQAARMWVRKIKEKCRLLGKHPEIGQARPDLGNHVRCTIVGKYLIFFRRSSHFVEIARVIRGDRDIRSL